MVIVEIVPATPEHAYEIAKNVRQPDVDELWAATAQRPLDVMLKGIARSEKAMTGMADGVPVCIWGVVYESFIGKVGVPWMVGSVALDMVAVTFLRRCRAQLMEIFAGYDMLVNYVDARNKKAIQWLRFMGFTISDEPVPYGIFKFPFHKFSMRRV